MELVNFEAFIVAITILTLTPGLDTALVLRNTSRGGFQDGCITSLGICCGLFVHATLSAIGVSAVLAQSPSLFQAVKSVGALYLIWLGITSVRSILRGAQGIEVGRQEARTLNRICSLREGFLSNVLNPKTAVFYFAFLPQFIHPQGSPIIQSLVLALVHFIIAMIWQCGLAGMLNGAKKLLNSRGFITGMEGTTAVILILLGGKLLLAP
ncbi:LysE family translocator [Vibrio sp. SM6]|uniref:LysE family translocator n=1 Tax=Vibrio agarilyticus TaxID=2726741 RepID=A0A7X8TPJ8_9VIBR|nr:LysE family translocator [Vibrio agarilyticus]NLS12471.1 LysE family translocator [Vibrio agarilyticus]